MTRPYARAGSSPSGFCSDSRSAELRRRGLWLDDGGSDEPAGAQVVERLVRACQFVRRDVRADRDSRRDLEEGVTIGAREIRDRTQHALAPQQLVRERGDVAHVRSEEHTSELQSLAYLVCRLLLEK